MTSARSCPRNSSWRFKGHWNVIGLRNVEMMEASTTSSVNLCELQFAEDGIYLAPSPSKVHPKVD